MILLYLLMIMLNMNLSELGISQEQSIFENNSSVYNYDVSDYMSFKEIDKFSKSFGDVYVEIAHAFNCEDEMDSYEEEVKIFISYSNLESKEGLRLYQVIDMNYEIGMAWDIKESIFMEDVNFDGNLDILCNLGHFGNQGLNIYAVYLYDKGTYVINEDYFMIQNLGIDYENEIILAHWRNHAGSHGHGLYKIVENKVIPYKILNIYWNEYEEEDELYYIEKYIVTEYESGEVINEITYSNNEYSEMELEDMFLNESSEWGLYTNRWLSVAYWE